MAAEPEARTKVFISYSRTDTAFAGDLVLGLAACGFAPYIDRADIAAGEDWEKRLSGLIAEADTVVYVISPDSIASDYCGWELAESQRLAKRVLPVAWRPVEEARTPADLKRLNYIFFSGEGHTFASGLSTLAEALRTDIGWIREHTRLAALAQRWTARGRAEAQMLRGGELDAALAWRNAKPMQAPDVTDAQADFIKASSDARAEAERRAHRARTGMLTTVSGVAIAMTALAGAALWQWRSAENVTRRLSASYAELDLKEKTVRAANLRLGAEIWLRTAPSDSGYYVIDKGWYPVASNYSGAVARVERSGGGRPASVSSGFIIDGALVHPRYAGEPLLVLPAGAIADRDPGGPPPAGPGAPADTLAPDSPSMVQRTIDPGKIVDGEETISVTFPALDAGDSRPPAPVAGAERVWRTPPQFGGEFPFQIWRLASPPPFGWRAVTRKDVDCQGFGAPDDTHTVAMLGIAVPAEGGPSPRALALNIGDLLDRSVAQNILYTHANNRVSAGAPVFDLATGGIFAIHIGSEPDPDRPGRRRAFGYSLRHLLDAVRQEMADKDAPMGPVCGS